WEIDKRTPKGLNADGTTLLEHANRERDPRIQRRLLALAHVADGNSLEDAAIKSGLNADIRKWIRRYKKQGVAGLRSKGTGGRPLQLSSEQLRIIRGEV